MRPILFCKQAVYGERNSEVERTVRTRGVLRSRDGVFHRSTAIATNARGNYYDFRACCGKGRAECCDRVYHTDALAGTDGIFVGAILRNVSSSAKKLLLAFFASACAISGALNRRASAAIRHKEIPDAGA